MKDMTKVRRHTANLDEVLIRRDETHAWLIYKDHPFEETFSLPIKGLENLTDKQVLDRFNAHIRWCEESIASERPLEIADGYQQLRWNPEFKKWSIVGNVLRCKVDWDREAGDPPGQLAIRIDDKLLSGQDFLDMIETYEGWGMRIEFVHTENLVRRPAPLVRKRKVKVKQIPYPKFD